MIKPYRDEIVQQIKEAGQELIERAESMVGNGLDKITDISIDIHLGTMTDVTGWPEITIHTSVANKKTLERWTKREVE
ncbi:hypothetical protein FND36_10180 [Lachnospiraceae bacterium KGMB03038]|nr:hypothetical protein FND36_10180 [Lachnospiraceae bacterium KGMB03038]